MKSEVQQGCHNQQVDNDLVAQYISGDNKAFNLIVLRHRRRMLWAARKYSHNEDDALDILQEAILRASRNLHSYRAEAALGTWLYKLVLNSGFDWAHHRQRRELVVLDDTVDKLGYNLQLSHDPFSCLDIALTIREASYGQPPPESTERDFSRRPARLSH